MAKRKGGGVIQYVYSPLPRDMKENAAFWAMSPSAHRVYEYFLMSWNGKNNGKLTAPFSTLYKLGVVKSDRSLTKALRELLELGLIELTALGSKKIRLANRYAIARVRVNWNPEDMPEAGYYIP